MELPINFCCDSVEKNKEDLRRNPEEVLKLKIKIQTRQALH